VADVLSVAEDIQRTLPQAVVVKTLNTVGNSVMMEPGQVSGRPGHRQRRGPGGERHRSRAGRRVRLGPDRILDLGGLSTAWPMEQYVGLWIALGTADINIQIHREG
jgi:predicted dinucleotide-binding enzyme